MTKTNGFSQILPKCWFIIAVVIFSLTSCATQVSTQATNATVEITENVDKSTRTPITRNKITLIWTDLEGNVLNSEISEDRETLKTELVSDGTQRLWIKVDAVGYIPVELAVRFGVKPTRIFSFPVEMERIWKVEGV